MRSNAPRSVLFATAFAGLSLLGTTAIGAAGVASATPRLAPAVRYASPTGVPGMGCPKTAPCDLVTAINTAPDGAEVVLAPGNYYKDAPLGTELSDSAGGDLNIHGPATGAKPVIYSSASIGLFLSHSDVSDLELVSTGSNAALIDLYGTPRRLVVIGSGSQSCGIHVTLLDSVCINTGLFGDAIETEGNSGGPNYDEYAVVIRGVTAIATGASGIGLDAYSGGYVHTSVTATNDIFKGGEYDVAATTNGTSPGSAPTAAVALSHSDYLTHHPEADNGAADGSATVTSDSSVLSTPPKFVNAAASDYRERASSPTVNKGAKDAKGATDLAGNPRTSGGAPDMGAYEVLHRPAVRGLKVTSKTAHGAKLTVKVNAEGLPTKYKLIATHKKHRIVVRASGGTASSLKKHHLKLHGLKPHTSYRLVITATNAGGVTTTKAKTLRTKR